MKADSTLWLRLWIAAYETGRTARLRSRGSVVDLDQVRRAALAAWRAELEPRHGRLDRRLAKAGELLADYTIEVIRGTYRCPDKERQRALMTWLRRGVRFGYFDL